MTLVEFLLARYDEEERELRDAMPTGARRNGKTAARRRLAEVEANRRTVELVAEAEFSTPKTPPTGHDERISSPCSACVSCHTPTIPTAAQSGDRSRDTGDLA